MMLMLWPFICILFLNQKVSSLEVVSQLDDSSSAYAYGSTLIEDDVSDDGTKVVVSGIDTSSSGNVDTNSKCYISIGRISSNNNDDNDFLDRTILSFPNMCLDIKLFGNNELSKNLPYGIVSAISLVEDINGDNNNDEIEQEKQQPMLFALNYNEEKELSIDFSSVILPKIGYFPSVMTIEGGEGGVYVALHDIHGLQQQTTTTLQTIRNYIRQMTYPSIMDRSSSMTNSSFHSPMITKYNMIADQGAIWEISLPTTEGHTWITAMDVVESRNALVVVGSTTGYGMMIGAMAKSKGNFDGFITIIDADTGKIDLSNFYGEESSSHSRRIRSQRNQNDVVLGLCTDDDKAYVVGSTTGKIEGTIAGGGAFVMKIDIDNLDPIWKKQIIGSNDNNDVLEATHCHVQDNHLYIGGNVPLGIRLDDENDSTTTSNIFVAKFDATIGTMEFIKQIDSDRNEELVGFEISETDEVYLTTNTWMFDEEQQQRDTKTKLYMLSTTPEDGASSQDLSSKDDSLEVAKTTLQPSSQPLKNIDEEGKDDTFTSTANDKTSTSTTRNENNVSSLMIAIIIVLSIILVFLFGYVIYYYSCSKRNKNQKATKITTPYDNEEEEDTNKNDNSDNSNTNNKQIV